MYENNPIKPHKLAAAIMASTGRVLQFKLFSFFLVVVNQGKNLFLFMLAAGGGSKAPAENIAGFGDDHESAGVFLRTIWRMRATCVSLATTNSTLRC